MPLHASHEYLYSVLSQAMCLLTTSGAAPNQSGGYAMSLQC